MKKYIQGNITVYAENFEEAMKLIAEIRRMESDF